jgi:pimeloyl-ACP methyl ester carboxylesterase
VPVAPGTDAPASSSTLTEEAVRVGPFRTRALALDGDGPMFVLLHGFADSADTWRPVLSLLGAEGRSAVALDLPGFARAAPLAEDEPVLSQLAAFAAAAVHRYSEDGPCVIVGNSLGGSAALLASADGAPAGRVVALAPAGFDMGGWIYRIETFTLLRALLRVPPLAPGFVVQRMVAQIYRQLAIEDQSRVGSDVVSAFSRHLRARATLVGCLRVADRLAPELSEPFELEAVDVPVDLVWGRQDGMLPYANAKLAMKQLPQARLTTIEGCGHCPQVERPEVVAEVLLGPGGAGRPTL